MQHIETIELGSSQSSITFSSIPQDYDDLVVLISARSDRSAATEGISIKPNGSTANLSFVHLQYDPGGVASGTTQRFYMPGASSTSNTFSNNQLYISNYSASQSKSFSQESVSENNDATTYYMTIQAGLWNDTSAITSLEFVTTFEVNNFVSGSVFSLYGVTAGGDGTVSTA
jgi:hypothetical protein